MEASTLNWEVVKVELNRRFIVIDEEKKVAKIVRGNDENEARVKYSWESGTRKENIKVCRFSYTKEMKIL